MRGKRYPQEQIIAILKEAEAGVPIPDLCRKHGLHESTIYTWKAKYAGLTVSEARRLKSLEDENGRLKRIIANQALDIEALKSVVSKNY
jgi:putative transposase